MPRKYFQLIEAERELNELHQVLDELAAPKSVYDDGTVYDSPDDARRADWLSRSHAVDRLRAWLASQPQGTPDDRERVAELQSPSGVERVVERQPGQ
jgi:hypothetical protein